jgi:hypothetical protein
MAHKITKKLLTRIIQFASQIPGAGEDQVFVSYRLEGALEGCNQLIELLVMIGILEVVGDVDGANQR